MDLWTEFENTKKYSAYKELLKNHPTVASNPDSVIKMIFEFNRNFSNRMLSEEEKLTERIEFIHYVLKQYELAREDKNKYLIALCIRRIMLF